MISVMIVDDKIDEEDEQLFFTLQLKSDLSDNIKLSPAQARLVILDNDGKTLRKFCLRSSCKSFCTSTQSELASGRCDYFRG